MKIRELIEALSYYDGDANVTFHFLRNNTEINCQFEDLSFYTDTMSVEFTIQDAYDGIEKVMFQRRISNELNKINTTATRRFKT